jgi:hypothetical protein
VDASPRDVRYQAWIKNEKGKMTACAGWKNFAF